MMIARQLNSGIWVGAVTLLSMGSLACTRRFPLEGDGPRARGESPAASAAVATASRPGDAAVAANQRPQPSLSPVHAPTSGDGGNAPSSSCDGKGVLAVHFYDVGQGLSALVDLPDGRHLLVDTGDNPKRPGCGDVCATRGAHLLTALEAGLGRAPLDLLWITHQHSDHMGSAPEILGSFAVREYVDNGRDEDKREVRLAHSAARARGTSLRVVDPEHASLSLDPSFGVKLTPVVPSSWPSSCKHDANSCSIGLRIDYCASSVLFTGDVEHDEEALLDTHGPITLLQVAHHASETSTTPGFLAKARPSYAVISSGKPGDGTNREYCHPRAIVVKRLTKVLGGGEGRPLTAFDGDRCNRAQPSDWVEVATTDRLWATARDGDVTLVSHGDGVFTRRAN
jgi:competence protein ComEC